MVIGAKKRQEGALLNMTQDQMREQKVRLTIELEDAEKHLRALQVAAQLHGDQLLELGTMLRDGPEKVFRHGESAHYGHPLETLYIVKDQMVNALNVRKVIEETNEIRKEAENVRKLRERLNHLG